MKRFLIKAFLRLFSWLPLSVHRFNAHILGWLARCVVRYRVKVVRENIDKAFPEKSPKERRKIFKDFYLHFAQIITETIWFSGCTPKRIRRSGIAKVNNPEFLEELQTKSDGTIILSAHCGNWEILGGFPYFDYGEHQPCFNAQNTANVYKRLTDPVWDDILRESRTRPLGPDYSNYVETKAILRHIIEHRKDKLFWLINTDQWPYGSAKAYTIVDFMHRKTRSMTAAAAIARKLNMSICYLSIVRGPKGKNYILEFKPIAENASTLTEQQIIDTYYKYIEEDIYADPGNYLWSHRRWKIRPDTQ